MAHRQYAYRDPLTILIEQEGRTCKGCVYLDSIIIFDQRKEFCKKQRKVGRKCTQHKEAE